MKFKKILGGICCFFAVGGIVVFFSNTSDESPIAVIGISIFFLLIAFSLFTSDKRKNKRTKKKEKHLNFDGITIYTAFHHVNGLPIAENLLCEVFSYPDRIDFKAGTTEIKLSRDKITDMCIKTDTDIQQQSVSSIGGAVAGAMLFGTLGAVIGGRVKNKKVKTSTDYLIITYQSEDELKYIGFDISNNPPSAVKLVKEFQENNTTSGFQIEL